MMTVAIMNQENNYDIAIGTFTMESCSLEEAEQKIREEFPYWVKLAAEQGYTRFAIEDTTEIRGGIARNFF